MLPAALLFLIQAVFPLQNLPPVGPARPGTVTLSSSRNGNGAAQAAPGARFTLIETSPYDDYTRKPPSFAGYNRTLVRFATVVRELAQKENQPFVDFNTPLVKVLQRARVLDPKQAAQIVPDFIHPGPAGHLIMAGALLQAWNAPGVVTTVRLDAAHRRVWVAFGRPLQGTPLQWFAALPCDLRTETPVLLGAVSTAGRLCAAVSRNPPPFP